MHARTAQALAILGAISLASTALAQDEMQADKEGVEYSGFLSDYSKLEVDPTGRVAQLWYVVPGGLERLEDYDALMIDQPEIFVAEDSKYKGMKPDQMTALAEAFREILVEELEQDYRIADAAGPSVMLMRVALGDVYMKKKGRGLFSYTPVGAVVHAAKKAAIDDLTKKLELIEVTLEMELLDSQSGEQLAALVNKRGQAKDKELGLKEEEAEWEKVEELMQVYASRLHCRLNNARQLAEQRVDCVAQHPLPSEE